MVASQRYASSRLHNGGVLEFDEPLKALADPSRRMLIESLNATDGQSLRELCAGLSMTRQSVSKHLAVLEAAHLVTTARRGREKLHYLNAEPIRAIAARWLEQFPAEESPSTPPFQWITQPAPRDQP
jgi:DNA-binding transcriptional ArsR family regulator